jgi:hypothetical protein
MAHWNQRAANTWNKHLSALNSGVEEHRNENWR